MMSKLNSLLATALAEDIPTTDITYDCLLTKNPLITATVISKQDGVFYGEDIFSSLFSSEFDSFSLSKKNGALITSNDVIATIHAPAKTIISRERILLNLIQKLSGIATLTKAFVDALDNPNISVLDTRKTTPGLRFLEKEAVLAGGGVNHRLSLSDMVLIKENHLSLLAKEAHVNTLPDRIKDFKTRHPSFTIEIEVTSLAQLTSIDFSYIDFVLLDNFSIEDVKKAVSTCKKSASHLKIECSGNITLKTIGYYRNLNIDRISVGSLTHSAGALDMSLLIDYA